MRGLSNGPKIIWGRGGGEHNGISDFKMRFGNFEVSGLCRGTGRLQFYLNNRGLYLLGPEAPRVAAVKKLNLVHRGKCRGFFVKFFAAIFPGN